jgi:hypothetical protein
MILMAQERSWGVGTGRLRADICSGSVVYMRSSISCSRMQGSPTTKNTFPLWITYFAGRRNFFLGFYFHHRRNPGSTGVWKAYGHPASEIYRTQYEAASYLIPCSNSVACSSSVLTLRVPGYRVAVNKVCTLSGPAAAANQSVIRAKGRLLNPQPHKVKTCSSLFTQLTFILIVLS